MIVALTLTGFASTFTMIWDSDVFWHLAGGEWMLRNMRILGTDPWSIDPEKVWVNVHWLFQVVVGAAYSIGGFVGLTFLKATLAAGIMLAFAMSFRKIAPPFWLMLCGLALLVTIAGRVRVRPESFTLLYMVLTLAILESVRRGGNPKRMWWLVPIMLLWVNMHGVYIVGQVVIWMAVGGAVLDRLLRRREMTGNLLTRQAIIPILVATAVCLATPWPFEAAIQPLLLWTRVSGQNDFYTYGVSELQPIWNSLSNGPDWMAFKRQWSSFALVVAALVAMRLNWRKTPIAHVLWLAPFVFLAFLAVRNVALLGPICAVLLAIHGTAVLEMLQKARPAIRKVWPLVTGAAVLLSLAMIVGYATEFTYHQEGAPFRFGAGLCKPEYCVDVAKYLANLDADGDVICDNFGDASPILFYSSAGRPRPKRLVYMDGRLEAHSFERFKRQNQIHQELQNAKSALYIDSNVEMPPSARFYVVRYHAYGALSALSQCFQRYRLVYVDDACACFADTFGKWGEPGEDEKLGSNLDQFDKPLRSDNTVEGTPAGAPTWYRQNPISLNDRRGQMFLALGQYGTDDRRGEVSGPRYRCSLLAVRHLTAALAEGQTPGYFTGLLAQAWQNRGYMNYYEPSPVIPVNADLARALKLYSELNLETLTDENTQYAWESLRTLFLSGHTDTSWAAITKFMANLPPRTRVSPPAKYFELRNAIMEQVRKARALAARMDRNQPLLNRVNMLTDPKVGLTEQAISEIQSVQPVSRLDGNDVMTLGDLYLRKGETATARELYINTRLPPADQWKLDLRDALCDWIDGKLHRAARELDKLAESTNQPLVRFYEADLLEVLGDYKGAKAALEAMRIGDVKDPELRNYINRLMLRFLDK
ncbi:MAG: hypothetical protein ACE15C_17340 [Phycisphaerae bacterium]